MKNIKLLEIFGTIDDEIVQKAIETNDAKKLKELKRLEKKKKTLFLVKYVSVLASSFAVLCIGVIMMNSNKIDNSIVENENFGIQVANPIIEVTSIDELENYIGMSLEKYKIKEIEIMTEIKDIGMIQILYKDETSIRISKDKMTDNSGIFNANLESTQTINSVEVQIYSITNDEEKNFFATWKDEKYSYTYYSNYTENIVDILSKIV